MIKRIWCRLFGHEWHTPEDEGADGYTPLVRGSYGAAVFVTEHIPAMELTTMAGRALLAGPRRTRWLKVSCTRCGTQPDRLDEQTGRPVQVIS
jgi:hypothetical protein